jgi:hypothetical protein
MDEFGQKMVWATIWPIFSETHVVTMVDVMILKNSFAEKMGKELFMLSQTTATYVHTGCAKNEENYARLKTRFQPPSVFLSNFS